MDHKMLARYPVGNPRRKWRQDNFILALASPGAMTLDAPSELVRKKTRRGVKTALDAGFDVLGCLWANSTIAMDIVRAAEQYGGKVLFQDMLRFGGMGDKRIFCQENDYAGAIRDTEKWRSVCGYIMWDEPILPEHLETTRKMIDYCEQVRPDLLPYTVANPDYHRLCRWEESAYVPYVNRFLDTLDPAQMDFDYYPIGKTEYDPDKQLDNSTMWSSLEIVRRAAAAREIPFWFYYQGQHFPWHKMHYTFAFPMARAMAFAGVLHGVKTLSLYTEFDGYVDPATGGKGVFFEEQKRLNGELHALGNTLMALNCLRVIHDDTLLPDHPTMVGYRTALAESELLSDENPLPRRISVSEHSDAYGNCYLMVLNRDYEQMAHLSLTLQSRSHVFEVSKSDGEQHFQHEAVLHLPVTLAPGDLALYRIQPATEAPFTVEYYLDK